MDHEMIDLKVTFDCSDCQPAIIGHTHYILLTTEDVSNAAGLTQWRRGAMHELGS